MAIASQSPPSHVDATLNQGDTGRPGVAEDMFADAGLVVDARGTVNIVNEWPALDIAVRALLSAGPSVPAIEAVGEDAFADALREALEPLLDPAAGLRIISEFGWIAGTRPLG